MDDNQGPNPPSDPVAIELPPLTDFEKRWLLDEAVLSVWVLLGNPNPNSADSLQEWHARVDELYRVLCVVARENKATPAVQAELRERRMLRSDGWRAYLGLAE